MNEENLMNKMPPTRLSLLNMHALQTTFRNASDHDGSAIYREYTSRLAKTNLWNERIAAEIEDEETDYAIKIPIQNKGNSSLEDGDVGALGRPCHWPAEPRGYSSVHLAVGNSTIGSL